MCTDYYHRRINPTTGQIQDDRIGQSGSGAFQFDAYPDQGLVSFSAWQARLSQENSAIVNGANKPVPLKDFMAHVRAMARRAMHRLYTQAPIVTDAKAAAAVAHFRDEAGHLFHRNA